MSPTLKQAVMSGLTGRYAVIWYATILLFLVSGLAVHGSLAQSTLKTLLPYVGALMMAATGQFLVIQAGGMDMSVPGSIGLSAMMVTALPAAYGVNSTVAAALGIVACCAAGLLSGLIVVYLRFSPIVSTLAVNALLVGLVLLVTRGFSYGATRGLQDLSQGAVLGVPTIFVIAVILVAMVALLLRKTSFGRRLVATGVNRRAAQAMGIPVRRYTVASYVAASLCFSLVGILLAGLVRNPGWSVGNTYLFTTFGAVVLGGSPLMGGDGSIVATAVGSVFLVQVNQMVLNLGGSTSTQYLIQGGVIAGSLLIGAIKWRSLRSLFHRFKPQVV